MAGFFTAAAAAGAPGCAILPADIFRNATAGPNGAINFCRCKSLLLQRSVLLQEKALICVKNNSDSAACLTPA